MVATSKMRRAQERVQQSRPLRGPVARHGLAPEPRGRGRHRLWRGSDAERPVRRVGYLLTRRRRSRGALPSNIIAPPSTPFRKWSPERAAETDHTPEVDVIAVGRKGRDFVVRSRTT